MQNGCTIQERPDTFSLERQRAIERRFYKPSPQPKVTIAIGIISKQVRWGEGEIVLAADSQTTFPEDGTKDLLAEKIHIIQFKNGKALIAQSGMLRPAATALAMIKDRAANTVIENQDTVGTVIRTAIRDHRKELLAEWHFTDDRMKSYLKMDVYYEFLVASYFNGNARLSHIDIYNCNFSPMEKQYAAIGTGSDLAKYLLKEFKDADPQFEYGDLIATSVIEKVKENVDGCGGKTHVGIVFQSTPENCGQAFIYPDELVADVAGGLKAVDSKLSPQKKELMTRMIHALWNRNGITFYSKPGP
jgi:hypothetical protein